MAHSSGSANDAQESAHIARPAFWASVLLALQLAYLFYGIDLDLRATNPGDRGLPLARIEDSRREVRTKLAGTLLWNPPDPGQALYRLDAIATMEGSDARVSFPDGTELTIEEGSLVIFEEPPKPGLFAFGRPGTITARLLRGSIKKTHSGTSPILLKFSEKKEAAALKLEDTSGASVFRVVFAQGGIRVIVESGSLRTQFSDRSPATVTEASLFAITPEGAPMMNPAPLRLPPPVLRKPTIEIQERPIPDPVPSSVLNFLFPSAWAGSKKEISITFSWDPIVGASRYQVQISSDEDFRTFLLEKSAAVPRFEYLSAPPEKDSTLFFRVAGVDAQGRIGEYSSTGRVEIQSQAKSQSTSPTPLPLPVPVSAPLPSAVATPRSTQAMIASALEGSRRRSSSSSAQAPMPVPISSPSPSTLPTAPEPAASEPLALTPAIYHQEISIGAVYHSRTLKNSDRLPRVTQGSGFVPARLRATFSRTPGTTSPWEISGGLTYLLEQASVTVPLTGTNRVGIATIQAWLTLSQPWGALQVGIGPYLASSHRIGFQNSRVDSQLLWLGGGVLQISPATRRPTVWHWEARLAPLVLGSVGADISFSAKRFLQKSEPRCRAESVGIFAGAEAGARLSGVEGSSAGIVEVGYGL